MDLSNKTTYEIPLSLGVSADTPKQGLYETGIPVPQGFAHNISQFNLECDDEPFDCAAIIVSRWYDQSIKWIHISFFTTQDQNSSYVLVINKLRTLGPKSSSELSVIDKNESINIQNEHFTCILNKQRLSMQFETAGEQSYFGKGPNQTIELTDSDNKKLGCYVESVNILPFHNLVDGTCISSKLSIKGQYQTEDSSTFADFDANITFYNTQSIIKYEFTIHNSNAALHPNGQWDLGDPNSIYIGSLNFVFKNIDNKQLDYQTECSTAWTSFTGKNTSIEQSSSGGENWLSPVHVDSQNSVQHTCKGYQHEVDGNPFDIGERATPTIVAKNNISLSLEQFWQNFPKAIYLSKNKIEVSLFPKSKNTCHELQAGEKKTHTLWIGTKGQNDELKWVHQTRQISIPSNWVASNTSLFALSQTPSADLISKLIANGLTSTNNFFEKREAIDEFGWRNFGDIYADHETAGYKGDGIFVSHYNNQYDPIFGFLRQYLLTGDSRWFELADDLTKHVKDIDIYHTHLDKNEYNGGLFWHTDHYLEAFTSSHRSYSKHQSSGAYQDHAGGGGPGGQHCYTTGLQLHYCMTGNESSKQAVLTLSRWITFVYEGSNTCLELLLAFKNRNVEGLKNHFTGQYPLDRGTANYIIAILDSYELTQEDKYLKQVETILTNTMHPNEDLTNRNLHDIENTWFYTVLLQALCRYLDVKQSKQELDDTFYYCRDCLLNFADWMLNHEYPYLDKPEILEYPNDTWTAQDLRKAHVFAGAYYYSDDKNPEYLAKAKFFEQYVANKLNSSQTKTYTRILVLLMQNHGAVDFYQERDQATTFAQRRNTWPTAQYQKTTLTMGCFKVLCKRLINISLKNELDWLKKRMA